MNELNKQDKIFLMEFMNRQKKTTYVEETDTDDK